MKKNNKNKDKKSYIIIILLLVIIILIVLFLLSFKIFFDNMKVPTGNIDVIDIGGNKEVCPTCESCKTCPTCNECKKDSTINPSKPVIKEEEPSSTINVEEQTEGFNIFDNKTVWSSQSQLRIFTNPAYEFEEIIAPGSSNSYIFRVRNNNNFNVEYNVSFIEENINNINMQYKLMLNGEYVKGDINTCVSYDQLNMDNIFLDAYAYNEYYLYWKWVESVDDTQVGMTDEATYKLKIEVIGTEV